MKKTLALAALVVASTGAGAFDATCSHHRCTVTFSGYTGTETLVDFPALVRIPAGSPIYADSPNGRDLRFVDGEDDPVPCEVDTWNTNGVSFVWVRVPRLSGTDTTLTLYSGGAPSCDACPRDVWSGADYACVWHFSGSSAESTTNVFHATETSTKPTYATQGPVGTTLHAGGFTIPNDARWTNFDGTNFSYSAWVRNSRVGYDRILSCKTNFSQRAGFEFTMQNAVNRLTFGGHDNRQYTSTVSQDVTADFAHITAVYHEGYVSVYVNGALEATSDTADYAVQTPLNALGVGCAAGRGNGWGGDLDEVRLKRGAPSADWIAANYATQARADFAVLGALEEVPGAKLDTSVFAVRCPLTVGGYAGETELHDFPLLVRLPPTSRIRQHCMPDGADLRFADAEGYPLVHEIDAWNPAGESTVWVRLPRLAPGGGTTIYAYAGGPAYENVRARDVWRGADYKGVWHFSGSNADSSPNALVGVNTSAASNFTWEGMVGTAFHASGGSYFTITNDSCWAGYDGNAFTLSGWVRLTPETAAASCYRIFSAKLMYNDDNGFELTTQAAVDKINAIGRGNTQTITQLPEPFTNDFAYVTAVYDKGGLRFYANGALLATKTSNYDILCATNNLRIGGQLSGEAHMKGELDELRLQWAAPGADWVAADYATQHDADFAAFGVLERMDGEAALLDTNDFHRVSAVVFGGYTGATPLVGFPALVRIPSGSPVYGLCAPDGGDIRFADAEGYLCPHEIDTWNPSGESLIWVCVPVLSGTGTTLNMFYHGRCGQSARPREVWKGAGYRGVWHFNGSCGDSSPNELASTSPGGAYGNAGIVGTALSMSSGSQQCVDVAYDSRWADYEGCGALTISGWVKTAKTDSGYERIFSAKSDHQDAGGFEFTLQGDRNRYNTIGGKQTWNAGNFQSTFTTTTDCSVDFVYFTAVMKHSSVTLYLNGSSEGELTGRYALVAPAVGHVLRLGAQGNTSKSNVWNGRLDELRLRWGETSTDWAKADYDTQHNAAFATVGAPARINTVGTMIIFR